MWRSLRYIVFVGMIACITAYKDPRFKWEFPRASAVQPTCQGPKGTKCFVRYDEDDSHVAKGKCKDVCPNSGVEVKDIRNNPPKEDRCPDGEGCICCVRKSIIRIENWEIPCGLYCEPDCTAVHGKCQSSCDPETQQRVRKIKCPLKCVCCKSYSETKNGKNMVSVKADPFFYTFDGKNFKYDGQNGCVYVLFQECVYRPSFSVLIRHHFIEDAEKMVVSEVSVVLEDIRISLIKQNIYVNDEIMGVDSPVTYGNLTVARVSSEHIKISLGSRFSLKWNGSGRVAPILDQSMFGKVCGLLGNGDSNPDNDMQIPMPDGTLKTVNNIEEFGDSWRVPGSCKA